MAAADGHRAKHARRRMGAARDHCRVSAASGEPAPCTWKAQGQMRAHAEHWDLAGVGHQRQYYPGRQCKECAWCTQCRQGTLPCAVPCAPSVWPPQPAHVSSSTAGRTGSHCSLTLKPSNFGHPTVAPSLEDGDIALSCLCAACGGLPFGGCTLLTAVALRLVGPSALRRCLIFSQVTVLVSHRFEAFQSLKEYSTDRQ